MSLLYRLNFPKGSLPPEGRVGIMSFEVNPEMGPYLVTSSKGLVWVPESGGEGTIKAAFRLKTKPEDLFREILFSIKEAGTAYEWGNVKPLTEEGVLEAIAHVKEYGLEEVEIHIAPDLNLSITDDTPVHKSEWVPPKMAVVIPTDRQYLGAWGRVSRRDVVAIVHNAARGIAIAVGGSNRESEGNSKSPNPD